jgi:hypothetical protein
MITRHKSTTYYIQGNGQVDSTNKTLKQILTKLVNANRNDWDVMLPTALWAYRTAYKVSTQHTPYELVYGLMSLLPTKFIVLTICYEGWKLDECIINLNGRFSFA